MIFNKNSQGANELRTATGQYWKSNDFEKVRVKVELATEDLANLIGTEVVILADGHYNSENYMADLPASEDSDPGGLPAGSGSGGSGLPAAPDYPLLDQLVQHMQLPVAFLATLWHYQGNNISHEDTGRKVKIDETSEKLAWEWMYDRDDAAAMRNYQRTLDRLIKFLNANINSFPEWKNSEARKATLNLFINTAGHFNQLYPIDSSEVFYLRLAPLMREIERKYIKPVLGAEKFAELKAAIAADNLPEDDEELVEYVCDAIPLLTMSKAFVRFSISLLPEGVVQQFVSERQVAKASLPATLELVKKVSKDLWADGAVLLNELKKQYAVYSAPEDEEPDITDMLPGMTTSDKFISL